MPIFSKDSLSQIKFLCPVSIFFSVFANLLFFLKFLVNVPQEIEHYLFGNKYQYILVYLSTCAVYKH